MLRIDALDGSGDYLLLENRQRSGSDLRLEGTGLLVWRIDQERVQAAWPSNGVNAIPSRSGVELLQADGRWDLRSRVNTADAADPFPGATGNTQLHATSSPASVTHEGRAAGITLTGITEVDGDISFAVHNGYTTVRVTVSGTPTEGLVRVDDQVVPPEGGLTFESAPFESHVLRAESFEAVGDGVRRPFEGWGDGVASTIRSVTTGFDDTVYAASYGADQVRLVAEVDGAALGLTPGAVGAGSRRVGLGDEAGWFTIGSSVEIEAQPTAGFEFLSWSGALSGSANPASWTAQAPDTVRARFSLGFDGLVPPLLGSGQIDVDLAAALDRAGNDNGVYDVGDLRAWLLAVEAGTASAEVLEAMGGVR